MLSKTSPSPSLCEIDQFLSDQFGIANYTSNFPQVFKQENQSFFCSEFEDAKLIAFCAIHPSLWHFQGSLLKGFCIGSVATDASKRSQGLGLKVLAQAEKRAREQSADFLFLFSELSEFYAKAGFQIAGADYFSILPDNLESSLDPGFHYFKSTQDLVHENLARVWHCVVTHSCESEGIFSFQEFLEICSIPNMECAFLLRDTKIVALCFIGKGNDFENVIHSLSFANFEGVLSLLKSVRQSFPKRAFLMMLGPKYREFVKFFEYEKQPGLMCKVLNVSKEAEILRAFEDESLYVRSLQST